MRANRVTSTRILGLGWLAAAVAFTMPAQAVEVALEPPAPTLIGSESTFSIEVTGAIGTPQIRWTFGDGTEAEFAPDKTTATHTYAAPGHYSVVALVQDDQGYASRAFVHAVHNPLTAEVPSATSRILLVEEGLVITANTDNGTISFVDTETLEKVEEISVFSQPVALAIAPDGLLWVLDQENYAVVLVDIEARKAVDFFRLPYASMPVGLVFAPGGDACITLMGTGDVIRIDSTTREIVAQKHVAPFLRGISVAGDGESLLVTRFITEGDHGEVFRVDAETLETLSRFDLMVDTTTPDSDVQGRGLPNYLFSAAVSPDGLRAWIPSKKDNMPRGITRDGLALTQDTAVRPLISILDLEEDTELVPERIDLDDRNLPTHVTFSAVGDWAFVSVFGSNLVELRDGFDGSFITALRSERLFGPNGSVLTADGRLFTLSELARELVVFDVSDLMNGVDQSTKLVAEIPLVSSEKLSAEVLRGKQIFANAEDKRMASEGYLSCSSCHFDGFEDGLVWDFTDRGEGVRNTISLLGRRGTGHGRVHWSANFDEIQDFDGPIRVHQAGLGFIPLEIYQVGTRSESLGDPKAGLDSDLDALAAYVTSLGSIPRSPFRKSDGTLTDDAALGRATFLELGCDSCHKGDDFTDSSEGVLHDVGTLTELSGQRLGAELTGLDTPTLLGIWQTPPYLHDGSAPTLRDVLTTRNAEGAHGQTAGLSEAELDQLVAYLQQIDAGLPPEELELPGSTNGSGGASQASGGETSSGGVVASGGASGGEASTSGGTGGSDSSVGGSMSGPGGPSGSSGCSVYPGEKGSQSGYGLAAVLSAFCVGLLRHRRLSRVRRG